MKNFIVRALTGVVFVAVILAAILWNPVLFAVVFGGISALAIWEFTSLVNQREDVHVNRFICTVGGLYLFFAFFGYSINYQGASIFIPYLIILLYLLISELYFKHENPMNNWAFAMLSQLYVALPFALLNTLAFQFSMTNAAVTFTPLYPLSLFVFLWANDTGAYCCGMLLGKHRLFPRISPKKSWEGSIGGGILAILVSAVICYYVKTNYLEWAGYALIVVVFGTWGDLVESLLKRQLGIKDSGNILPGHGGILDRMDSSLLAIPAAVIYLFTLSIL